MDPKEWLAYEERCIQEQPPGCVTSCPVHVDVRSFAADMEKGDFQAAFEVFRKNVPFPGIIGRICNHPCELACTRSEVGSAVAISELEATCVRQRVACGDATVASKNMAPKKKQRVAVVGGGLSGLAAAVELSRKGYAVVLYEAGERLGGRVLQVPKSRLPEEVVTEETASLEIMGVDVRLKTQVGRDNTLAEMMAEFDAIYLGTGDAVSAAALHPDLQCAASRRLQVDAVTFATSIPGVFAGGGARLTDEGEANSGWPITSLSDGRRAALSIDRFLQGASLTAVRADEGAYESRLYTNTAGIEPLPRTVPQNAEAGYSPQEAMAEAERCMHCECMECVKNCEYLSAFKAYPKKYARQINQNLRIVMGVHGANSLINSCSLCGLCKEVCPTDFDMSALIREARQDMVHRGKMPPSAHDFPLSEMELCNGEKFALTRHQPGFTASTYAFFPGCQLSASAPQHVERVYDYLMSNLRGGVGLMLRCCGAPADWAGDTAAFAEGLEALTTEWKRLGRPRLILACSTCYQTFQEHLPEIEIASLWDVYDEVGLPPDTVRFETTPVVAVHDSCTTRYESHIHDSVRNILGKLGCEIEELENNRERTECCGYGGLMMYANRPLAQKVAARRSAQSSKNYVSYCAMCRDSFAAQGKGSYHILDLIYGLPNLPLPVRKGPDIQQRRENREALKRKMLNEVWRESTVTEEHPHKKIALTFSEEVAQRLEERWISTEDVQKVIYRAETSGDKVLNQETGHILACFPASRVTYWAEYAAQGDKYVVYNAYSHRMAVQRQQ